MSELRFTAGEQIFAEGDPAEAAFVIQVGEVDIIKDIDGAAVVLARLGVGEIFGEMGLVDDKPRSAGARAVGAVRLERMSHEHFLYVLLHRPEESISYLKALFERLRAANANVAAADLPNPTATADNPPAAIRILAATAQTRTCLPEDGLGIDHLPFRVGRDHPDPLGANDLVLVDQPPYSVSRYHFLIDREGEGFVVRDRGSYLGTIVNGEPIGGQRHNGQAPLKPGSNTIVVGSEGSPFGFDIVVPEG